MYQTGCFHQGFSGPMKFITEINTAFKKPVWQFKSDQLAINKCSCFPEQHQLVVRARLEPKLSLAPKHSEKVSLTKPQFPFIVEIITKVPLQTVIALLV